MYNVTSAIAAAAAVVGSRPGGSSIIAVTTLSFLPCARLACGDIASAAIAASMDSFLNMRILLNETRRSIDPKFLETD